MSVHSAPAQPAASRPDWHRELARFQKPDLKIAIWQLTNTMALYGLLWYLMYLCIVRGYSYWIVLGLAVLASGMLLRIFIIFHDCCHGSFFASQRANRILGTICGILTFTAYDDWRHAHNVHHATAGNLDRRGTGDVWTMTVQEYRAASRWTRLTYRLYRNPIAMFGVGPAIVFLITHRFPHRDARKRDRQSVWITNLAILAILLVASLTIGLRAYILIQLPIVLIGCALGVWLFYVQHQFAGVYWARDAEWDPVQAALAGSSYYKLPRVLQWFSGNIGFHHVHHARPRIPNYNLQRCYEQTAVLQAVEPVNIRKSLKSLWLNLWDEEMSKLVSFRSLRATSQ